MSKKLLEEIQELRRKSIEYLVDDYGESHVGTFVKLFESHYEWLIEQAESINSHAPNGRNYTNEQYVDLLHENERYRKVIENMKSEIEESLYSNKSEDVKRFYLENAVRYANRALEGESDE